MPWLGIGTQRSRGIDSMVACLVLGSTRRRIIDWVLRRSGMNFESSSEPSSKTVNGCVGGSMGFRLGRPSEMVVEFAAVWNTGRKYAPRPPIPRSEEHTSELQSHSDLVC